MSRPAAFHREQISQAALELVAEHGPAGATIGAIAGRLGAPTGSIYHRFESRGLLLADLWLTTVEGFQVGLMTALRDPDTARGGIEAALHTPRWVRAHPLEARLLLLHRREDLVGEAWPDEVRGRAVAVGTGLAEALRSHARRRFGRASKANLARVRFAVIDVPYGALKRYVQKGTSVPPLVDEMIATAAEAVLCP